MILVLPRFIRNNFHNAVERTSERFADPYEDLDPDVLILAEFGHCVGADIRHLAKLGLCHFPVDQQFPQFVIANSHLYLLLLKATLDQLFLEIKKIIQFIITLALMQESTGEKEKNHRFLRKMHRKCLFQRLLRAIVPYLNAGS